VATAVLPLRGSIPLSNFHLLALPQTADAGTLQRGGVDEYVLFEVVRLNETQALSVVVGQYSASVEMFFH
jgi:hypothetical protein